MQKAVLAFLVALVGLADMIWGVSLFGERSEEVIGGIAFALSAIIGWWASRH